MGEVSRSGGTPTGPLASTSTSTSTFPSCPPRSTSDSGSSSITEPALAKAVEAEGGFPDKPKLPRKPEVGAEGAEDRSRFDFR
jgi:hypothetical protein